KAGGSLFLSALFAAVFALPLYTLSGQNPIAEHWVGTWSAAAAPQISEPGAPMPVSFKNRTLRQIVHTSIGGDRVRIVFNNAFGTAPLAIGGASISLRGKGAAIQENTSRRLTFAGKTAALILGGSVLVSDAVDLSVHGLVDFAIDLYLPGDTNANGSPL